MKYSIRFLRRYHVNRRVTSAVRIRVFETFYLIVNRKLTAFFGVCDKEISRLHSFFLCLMQHRIFEYFLVEIFFHIPVEGFEPSTFSF